jgi:hypothetical protein
LSCLTVKKNLFQVFSTHPSLFTINFSVFFVFLLVFYLMESMDDSSILQPTPTNVRKRSTPDDSVSLPIDSVHQQQTAPPAFRKQQPQNLQAWLSSFLTSSSNLSIGVLDVSADIWTDLAAVLQTNDPVFITDFLQDLPIFTTRFNSEAYPIDQLGGSPQQFGIHTPVKILVAEVINHDNSFPMLESTATQQQLNLRSLADPPSTMSYAEILAKFKQALPSLPIWEMSTSTTFSLRTPVSYSAMQTHFATDNIPAFLNSPTYSYLFYHRHRQQMWQLIDSLFSNFAANLLQGYSQLPNSSISTTSETSDHNPDMPFITVTNPSRRSQSHTPTTAANSPTIFASTTFASRHLYISGLPADFNANPERITLLNHLLSAIDIPTEVSDGPPATTIGAESSLANYQHMILPLATTLLFHHRDVPYHKPDESSPATRIFNRTFIVDASPIFPGSHNRIVIKALQDSEAQLHLTQRRIGYIRHLASNDSSTLDVQLSLLHTHFRTAFANCWIAPAVCRQTRRSAPGSGHAFTEVIGILFSSDPMTAVTRGSQTLKLHQPIFQLAGLWFNFSTQPPLAQSSPIPSGCFERSTNQILSFSDPSVDLVSCLEASSRRRSLPNSPAGVSNLPSSFWTNGHQHQKIPSFDCFGLFVINPHQFRTVHPFPSADPPPSTTFPYHPWERSAGTGSSSS